MRRKTEKITKVDGLIAEHSDFLPKIDEKYRSGEVFMGFTIGIPKIDDYLRFKRYNLNLFLGHSNVGKSALTFWYHTMLAIENDLKFLIYSAEDPVHDMVARICSYYAQKPVNAMEDDEYIRNMNWVHQHFRFVKHNRLYTYYDCIELALRMRDEWEFDCLVVDPYNTLVLDLQGLDTHSYHYEAIQSFRVFSEKTAVSCNISVHSVTESQRQIDKKTGHMPPPIAAHAEGGGKFVNTCDQLVTIHRQIYDPDLWFITELHVRKVRSQETGGKPTSYNNPIELQMTRNRCGFILANTIQAQAEQEIRYQQMKPF